MGIVRLLLTTYAQEVQPERLTGLEQHPAHQRLDHRRRTGWRTLKDLAKSRVAMVYRDTLDAHWQSAARGASSHRSLPCHAS
jgi:hypothetical protein